MKFLIKVLRSVKALPRMIYYKIRSLFPRKTLRYIDWFFLRDRIKVYGGLSLKDAVNQVITTPPSIVGVKWERLINARSSKI